MVIILASERFSESPCLYRSELNRLAQTSPAQRKTYVTHLRHSSLTIERLTTERLTTERLTTERLTTDRLTICITRLGLHRD